MPDSWLSKRDFPQTSHCYPSTHPPFCSVLSVCSTFSLLLNIIQVVNKKPLINPAPAAHLATVKHYFYFTLTPSIASESSSSFLLNSIGGTRYIHTPSAGYIPRCPVGLIINRKKNVVVVTCLCTRFSGGAITGNQSATPTGS